MTTAVSKNTNTKKMNPVLKAVLCFIAFVGVYFGVMGILSAMNVIPFERAIEPFRLLVVILGSAVSAFQIYVKNTRK